MYSPSLGNVSVWFPGASEGQNIAHACDAAVPDDGGFVVEFKGNLGDLPLMAGSDPRVSVVAQREGTSLRAYECSGPHMGICDRSVGKCKCYDTFASSNGSAYTSDQLPHLGNRGDCSHMGMVVEQNVV